jgi:DNA invertase Pin-like site-specific DNA recombinase
MADAAQRKFDCIVVYKIDRFGRSVLHLNQQLAALTSYGVRFIATSQSLDTDEKNPASRLLLQILASVAEFKRKMIRERTLSGIKSAQAAGKVAGRPKRIFRHSFLPIATSRQPVIASSAQPTWSCSVDPEPR